jgi:hypothetical protein
MARFENLTRRVMLSHPVLINYFCPEVTLAYQYKPKGAPATGEEDSG